jgi:hypothetical protein
VMARDPTTVRRIGRWAPLVACAALLAASAGGATAPASATRPCHPVVRHGVLPAWARTGFSAPRPRLPHAIARHGRIAALLFGVPLTAPPREDVSNKILWVSHVGQRAGEDLLIRAQRMRGTRRLGKVVRRRVEGGPGPSGVDLPRSGCWRLSLRWSGHRDRLDVRYVHR